MVVGVTPKDISKYINSVVIRFYTLGKVMTVLRISENRVESPLWGPHNIGVGSQTVLENCRRELHLTHPDDYSVSERPFSTKIKFTVSRYVS